MSDESEPPALSLRPRKKPEDDTAGTGEGKDAGTAPPKLSLKPKSAEKAPAPGAGADATTEEKPRLSLKPKAKPAEPAPAPAAPETPQPRAKPKLSIHTDSEPAATTPAAPPASESPPAADPASPRPKPKLSLAASETASEEPVEPEPTPESEAPPPPVEIHRDETNPGIDPAVKEALKKAKSEKPKLKLTVSKADSAASPATPAKPPLQQSSGFVGDAAAPPPPPSVAKTADADPSLPPPLPVVTNAEADPATTPPLPPPAQLAEDNDEDDDSEAPARKRLRPEQRPIFKIAVMAVILLLIGGIGAGGYLVYTMFFASPELNPYTAPLQAVSEPTPAETPAEGPASMAGQLIEKAQGAVDAHNEVVEAANEAAEVTEASAATTSPQVTIDISDAPVAPTSVQPSAAFQDWVNNVVISGVAETSNPRAFINGVLVKRGDTVDHGLGIVFDDIDGDENLVLFKDASGALVGKRY